MKSKEITKKKELKNSLNANQITSNGAIILFDRLRRANSHIVDINLSFNYKMNEECMRSLGEYIKSNKSIGIINERYAQISDASIEILASYLEGSTSFKRLYFDGNKYITDLSIPLMTKIIQTSHVEYIGISNTSVTQTNILVVPLAHNTIKNKSIKLNFSYG